MVMEGHSGCVYAAELQHNLSSAGNKQVASKALVVMFSSFVLIVFAAAARGELLLFLMLGWKNWDHLHILSSSTDRAAAAAISKANLSVELQQAKLSATTAPLLDLEAYSLQDLPFYMLVSVGFALAVFFGLGGFLQWWFYVRQRATPETWKCQPKRFLTKENERHEIMLGGVCVIMNSCVSSVCVCYVANGGHFSKVYFDVSEYGWTYLLLSSVGLFLLQDATSYYYHRMLHFPFFYRNFHKWHHRYHSPTAFSATAMHPVESTVFEILLLVPIFVVPLHFLTIVICFCYLFYFGILDHSGIDMDSWWPWQPPTRFHDDHHQFFHVNFGFNTLLFDRFHDTLRRKDRKYGEDIFYGRGSPLTASSKHK